MSNGYIKGQPDVTWWLQQARFGIDYRKKKTYQKDWATWKKYYRNEFASNIQPSNIFFKMVRTVVPRIYFRNPSISITPGQPGMLNWAFAQVLERVDNKLIKSMRVKRMLKKAVQNAWFYGTGTIKCGYGAAFSYDFEKHGVEAPAARSDKRSLETFSAITDDMPWVRSVHTGNLIVPAYLDDFADTPWIAEWVRRPLQDVKDDPRLKNTAGLGASSRTSFATDDMPRARGQRDSLDMVDLLEIHDLRTGKAIVLAPYTSQKTLLFSDDGLSMDGISNYFNITFNPDDDCAWGIPDSKIIEDQQLEINHLRTIQMAHWRLSVIKILAKRGSIKDDEADKLVTETVKAVVNVEGDPNNDFRFTDGGGIPPGLFQANEQLMQDIRESAGFSRNEFGDHMPASSRTSATESQIVKQASEIRIDERRDEVADVLVDVMNHVNRLVFDNWDNEQVLDIVGPLGVPLWVKFKPSVLKEGHYNINIDPDTSLPESKDARQNKAVQVYSMLKDNPLIDPMRLTRYLLHELHGVQFDDMMRGVPPGLGGPTNPIGIQEYAQLATQIASQAPNALQGGNVDINSLLQGAQNQGGGQVPGGGQ